MKKNLWFRMLLFLTVVSLTAVSYVYGAEAKKYLHKKLNYSINYPAKYELKIIGDIVVFVSPEKDKKFAFAANVNIISRDLKEQPQSLKKFAQDDKAQMLKTMGNLKFLEEAVEKIGGMEAYRMVYTSKQNKVTFKFLEIRLVSKKRAYIITYTSLLEEYDRYLREANSIINSFKILEK